jgi:predicted dehydrogenase
MAGDAAGLTAPGGALPLAAPLASPMSDHAAKPRATNNQQPVRLAVVGLGKMGIMHASMAKAAPGVELVALCDLDPKLVEHVRSMAGEASRPAGFTDLAKMLAEAKPDGAIIATPQFAHRAVVEQCLAAGVAALVEKPLAHRLDEAEVIARAVAAKTDVPFGVGFMKGHDDFYLLGAALAGGDECRSFIRNGGAIEPAPWFAKGDTSLASPIGRAKSFRASVSLGQVFKEPKGWTFTKEKAGGGVLINTGIHLLFLLRLFFGRLTRVACLASPIHAKTEDTLSAIVEHENADGHRVHGTVHVSWSVPDCPTEATEIFVEGDAGWLWFEDDAARVHLRREPMPDSWALPLRKGWNGFERARTPSRAAIDMSPEYGGEGYANEVADFAEALRDRRACRFGARHGLELQAAVDAYYRSAEANGAWVEPKRFD